MPVISALVLQDRSTSVQGLQDSPTVGALALSLVWVSVASSSLWACFGFRCRSLRVLMVYCENCHRRYPLSPSPDAKRSISLHSQSCGQTSQLVAMLTLAEMEIVHLRSSLRTQLGRLRYVHVISPDVSVNQQSKASDIS